jgi:hypothetical protein
MTVFRVLGDIPEVSPLPGLRPGVEVVFDVVENVVLDPSVLVLVTTSMIVDTTGVGVLE